MVWAAPDENNKKTTNRASRETARTVLQVAGCLEPSSPAVGCEG
jgi:hypothetical protein